MPRVLRSVLTNFSSGELNPLLATRTDVASYFQGAKQCRNFALLSEGGVMRRPGTTYLASLPAECRLIPFIFSDDEVAIIVLSNNRMDVYNTSGTAITSNYTTNCNWTTAQLFELNFAQFGDTIYVTHRNNAIRKIFRESASSFTVTTFAFDTHSSGYPIYQPYYKYADSATTISTSATTGSVTVTASANTFTSSWVGINIRKNKKTMTITGYTSATEVTATVNETLDNTTATADWDEQTISSLRGYPQAVTFHNSRLWFGGLFSRPAGIVASKISEYTNFDVDDGESNDAIDLDIAGDQVNEVRHMISGKELLIFTDGGEYYVPPSSDNTITPGNISIEKQTPYGISRTAPQMFDQAAGYVQKNGKTIREFIYSDIEDGYKSASVSVLAQHLIDNPKQIAIMKGNTVRPEQYAFFLNNGTTQTGKLSVFHSIRDEKIAGWSLWSTRTNDLYQSIVALNDNLIVAVKRQLNSSTVYTLEKFSDDDSVTLDCQGTTTLSQRGTPLVDGGSQSGTTLVMDGLTSAPVTNETFTIAGNATEYTIQGVTDNGSGEYSVTLDKTLAATPGDNAVITFTKGFFHTVPSIYQAEKVNAVVGNSSLGEYTVTGSNTITLTTSAGAQATGVKVGFNYIPIIETMPVDKELPEGPLTGLPKRISRAIVDINSTLDMTIKAADKTAKELVVHQLGFTAGSDLEPVTSKKEFYFLGYSKNPTVTISQNDPLPLRLLGMSVEVVFV